MWRNIQRSLCIVFSKRWLAHIRLNDTRDSYVNFLDELYNYVKLEPCTQTLLREIMGSRGFSTDDDAQFSSQQMNFIRASIYFFGHTVISVC